MVERIVALKADAEARGFGALAYFLEMPASKHRSKPTALLKSTRPESPSLTQCGAPRRYGTNGEEADIVARD
ncbi:MAG: hypothetical protein LCH80_14035 [Proteobacteria bacterium]|nr:hypothetical protein [Pseudomonadota bacterium]